MLAVLCGGGGQELDLGQDDDEDAPAKRPATEPIEVDNSEEEEGVQRGDEDAGYYSSADTLSIHGSEDEDEGKEEEEETAEPRGAGGWEVRNVTRLICS